MSTTDTSGDAAVATEQATSQRHWWYRVALAITFVLVLGVVAVLPLAIRSMQEVLGRGSEPLYDLFTGAVVTAETAHAEAQDVTYVNMGLISLDAATGQVTLAASGNRLCGDDCPTLGLTFVALDNDADKRRGLPPSATLTLSPTETVFSQPVTLPVRGNPSLYPFDRYTLWLGVAGEITAADGTVTALNQQVLAGRAAATLQNRVPSMLMQAPTPLDPAQLQVSSDPFDFIAVQSVQLHRPAYLQVLAAALVGLISISALLAMFTRTLSELALGFGGLILGVWGVRSILMPQSLGVTTAIDLALSWLILLLLLGLAIRALLHFLRHSKLPVQLPRGSIDRN